MNEPQVKIDIGPIGMWVTIANVLIAGVLIVGILYDNRSVTVAVLAGAAYFSLSTTLVVLGLSGSLTNILIHRQSEITLRRLHELQYAATAVRLAEPMPLPDADRVQTLPGSTFVPAVDDGARREAIAYALQLYGADGLPDATKVHLNPANEAPGRLRMAAPSKAAKEYLLVRRVLINLGNGYRLNIGRYPTLSDLKAALA